MKHFDFGRLNSCQRQAVTATEGPVLVIAGPGTGKTYTLVKRISYLVFEKNVSPSSIMVVTFTEKAAKELLTRISDEFLSMDENCRININEMYIGTFHSVCLRLIKEFSKEVSDNHKKRVMDAFEQTYLVYRNIESFNHYKGFYNLFRNKKDVWYQACEICRYVNQLQEELADIDKMVNDVDADVKLIGKLAKRYQDIIEKNKVIDFSSIQIEAWRLLSENTDICKAIQNKIDYIMVDEYQDTNYIQEQLIFKIAGDKKNICVVGDDDQGMYRFRGATIRNIFEFSNNFANGECQLINLNENYRSEPDIIDFYNNWMQSVDGLNLFNWNRFRYSKQIHSGKENVNGHKAVFNCNGETIDDQKHKLYSFVKKLKSDGSITNFNQIAFLFRSVRSSEAIAVADYFEENGIPVYSPRSKMFFERTEVKQLLGCIILCFRQYSSDLKKNLFRYPISADLQNYYISCCREASALVKRDEGLKTFMTRTMNDIMKADKCIEIGLLDIFYRLISFEPFRTELSEDVKDNVLQSRAARNLSEISRLISKFSFLHDMHMIDENNKNLIAEQWFNVFLKCLYIDGVGEYEDDSEYAPSGCVSFMTIHQSKGLEFPVIVVGSLDGKPRENNDSLMSSVENRFFHRKPFEPMSEIKYFDFWRLYYVAFSRAQNLLVLSGRSNAERYFSDFCSVLPDTDDYEYTTAFENVKKVKFKRVYSFTSHIALYDGCPRQYKYYKEYGFAQNKMFHTSVGSLVHATLEDMNKCIINGQQDSINESAIVEWFSLNYLSMQEQTGYLLTDEQKENALSQVIRYYKHRKDELNRVWKAEEEINLVLPQYILQGIIDLVEGEGDTVEIVDYKTGPKPDENDSKRLEHYKKQLEIYAYLIEKRYAKKVSRMHLYYTSTLSGNPIITFEYNKGAIDKTIEEISHTVNSIESKCFEKDVQNNYACQYCDMRYLCGKE